MSKMLEIDFGALALPLAEQLAAQGLVYKDAAKLAHFQADAEAIVRLHMRGYIADSVAMNCRKKLMKKMNPSFEQHNQENPV
jgi:hypothetical protein